MSAQLIVHSGLHYTVLTMFQTLLKYILHLLTSNPYYNPMFKMGSILICIFENSIYLESSRARIETQAVWFYSP